ncbi:MAG TPA: cysteine--tRNA ligase, partial [Chloroflexota bacterium]|nr:cysteine--tRNA ligase [Chloroflexota bacterium]
RRTMLHLLDVLGIDLTTVDQQQAIDPYVDLLLDVRRKLREAKQWALADEIRGRLDSLGIIVEDKPGGESTWRPADR